MFTLVVLLLLGAFATAIAAAMSKCPLWISVILTILAVAVQVIPIS